MELPEWCPVKVISFYMNEQTERAALVLAHSLQRYGMEHDFESVPDQGSYQKNRQHVPSWILWKLLEDSSQSVTWLNTTASIRSDPVLLKNQDCDLGVFYIGGAYWAKTLYVKNSEPARKTIRRWADLNLEYPDRISCENFTQAIEETKPSLSLLPPAYSWLEESFPKTFKGVEPVILHPIGGL